MDIASTIEAGAAVVGVLAMIGGGVFGMGKISSNIEANTKATEKLTTALDTYTGKTDDRLTDHEIRIVRVETVVGSGKYSFHNTQEGTFEAPIQAQEQKHAP